VKRIVISLEAEAALDDILIHTIERWSQAQAEIYIGQLTERLRALASGRQGASAHHHVDLADLVRGLRVGKSLESSIAEPLCLGGFRYFVIV